MPYQLGSVLASQRFTINSLSYTGILDEGFGVLLHRVAFFKAEALSKESAVNLKHGNTLKPRYNEAASYII